MAKGLGGIAFVVGLVLAAIIALFSAGSAPAWAIFALAVLGLIVGLFNIQEHETTTFLVAAVTFMISFQALGAVIETLAFGWGAVSTFFNLMNVFVAPAAAVVALIALFQLSRA